MEDVNFKQDIDIKALDNTVCSECGGIFWNNVTILKKVSPIMTENGKPGFVPVPTWACISCNNVNEELNPLKVLDLQ